MKTTFFKLRVSVKQGNNLSPNILKIYFNDIVDAFNKEVRDAIELGPTGLNCLLYACDSILLSESEAGLHKCLDKLGQYCKSWFLNVNYKKVK